MQQVNWGDDANNRIVKFDVHYTVNGSDVQIDDLTPSQVQFLDPKSREVIRTVGVWTDAGRNMLKRQFLTTTTIEDIQSQVAADLLATA